MQQLFQQIKSLKDDEIPLIKQKSSSSYDEFDENSKNLRTIDLPQTKHNIFPSNKINTTSSSTYSFLAMNLITQLMKPCNLYFALLSVLQTIPSISNTGGQPVILIPLLIVVILSVSKDFYEHQTRIEQDNEENQRKVLKADPENKTFIIVDSQDLKVGDVVKIKNNQMIPADLLLLRADSPNCYLDTCSLDGETNLKSKYVLPVFQQMSTSILSQLKGQLICDLPNNQLYYFEGTFLYKTQDGLPCDCLSIHCDQLLLRSSRLRNTQWVIGLVIYTGHDTKILMNQKKQTRRKQSKLEQRMNIYIGITFIIQVVMCFIAARFGQIWSLYELPEYVDEELLSEDSQLMAEAKRFGRWLIVLSNLVPISLLVTLESVRFAQSHFVNWDVELFDSSRGIQAQVNTSSLNEELGQIDYVFTDKTGTLTQNQLELRKVSIGFECYGTIESIVDVQQTNDVFEQKGSGKFDSPRLLTPQKRQLSTLETKQPSTPQNKTPQMKWSITDSSPEKMSPDKMLNQTISTDRVAVDNVNFEDERFETHYNDPKTPQNKQIINFLTHMSLCHTVNINPEQDHQYQAQSPDELALVTFASNYNVVFKSRSTAKSVTVSYQLPGRRNKILKNFDLLQTFEFTPERKRMSVIVKETKSGLIKVLTKGADSVLLSRLASSQNELKAQTENFLKTFAQDGLRTLVICERIIPEEEYVQWQQTWQQAAGSIRKQSKAIALIERDFTLIGSTALLESLQHGVAKTVETLKSANIKIWMMTGDREETAVSVGYSTHILTPENDLCYITGTKKSQILDQITEARKMQLFRSTTLKEPAFVITGDSLQVMEQNPQLLYFFKKVVSESRAVIACRMTPKQKSDLVSIMREHTGQVILAIGDGANDVSMIKEANIGIGIRGAEGTQACSVADFSIQQFAFLQPLILVHGRESYRRNSYLVLYTLYKNLIFVLPQFYFGIYSGFSGQGYYDPIMTQIFNAVFTAWPVATYACFDFERSKHDLITQPKLYQTGPKNGSFGWLQFAYWFGLALTQGTQVFFISFVATERSTNPQGMTSDLWLSGGVSFAAVIIVVTSKILSDTNSFNYLIVIVSLGSILSYFVCFFFWSLSHSSYVSGDYQVMASFPQVPYILAFLGLVSLPLNLAINLISKEIEIVLPQYLKTLEKKQSAAPKPEPSWADEMFDVNKSRRFSFES